MTTPDDPPEADEDAPVRQPMDPTNPPEKPGKL